MSRFLKSAVAALAFVSIVDVASAAQIDGPHFARPSADIKMRSGPGTDYSTDAVLKRSELLFVQNCQGDWCFVRRDGGQAGWAMDTLLINVATPSDRNADGSKKTVRVLTGPVLTAPTKLPINR